MSISQRTLSIMIVSFIFLIIVLVTIVNRYLTYQKENPVLYKNTEDTLDKIIRENGVLVKNVPPVLSNLTFTLEVEFRIKNHSNAYKEWCLFYRGYDCDSASPSVWFMPWEGKLLVRFRDVNNEEMIITSEDIPLQRWNTLYLSCQNRKVYIIINGLLVQSALLPHVPKYSDTPIKLLPSASSARNCDIRYVRFYNSFKRMSKLSEDFEENFDNMKKNKKESFEPYDEFYSKVYTELFKNYNVSRAQYETDDLVDRTFMDDTQIELLDIGSGGGNHLKNIQDKGYCNIKLIGLDKSPYMLQELEKNLSKKGLSLICDTAHNPSLFPKNSLTHITCYSMTIYYTHFGILIKNVWNWLKPGGWFVVHLVDSDNFEPVPDITKAIYKLPGSEVNKNKKRLTRGEIRFDTFSYVFDYTCENENATIKEVFNKKDGTTQQKNHSLIVPSIDIMKEHITSHSLNHVFTLDLTKKGYKHQYIYYFQKPKSDIYTS